MRHATLEDLQNLLPATLGEDAARVYREAERQADRAISMAILGAPRWEGSAQRRRPAVYVEPGQVWDPGGGRPVRVVSGVDQARRLVSFAEGFARATIEMMGACWRLVGLELPDGQRIMVGDERTAFERTFRVTEIKPNARLAICDLTWDAHATAPAAVFVSWTKSAATMVPFDRAAAMAAVTVEVEPASVDPKVAREQRRREIDAILRDDARAVPAFAVARLRAVMAALEPPPLYRVTMAPIEEQTDAFQRALASIVSSGQTCLPSKIDAVDERRDQPALVRDILAELHHYEAHRGGETRPRRDLTRWLPAAVHEAVEVYERSRGLP